MKTLASFVIILSLLFTRQAAAQPSGILDLTFGTNGMNISTFSSAVYSSSEANAIAIQKDGKIVAVGYSDNSLVVLRYKINGVLDSTFNQTGIFFGSEINWRANAVVIQKDGKIVVGGYSGSSITEFLLLRLNTDGTLDNSYGTNGIVKTKLSTEKNIIRAMAIQNDDKVVVAGSVGSGQEFCIARYKTDGKLDNSFDTNGWIVPVLSNPDFIPENGVRALVIQSDNKILFGGNYFYEPTFEYVVALFRINNDGTFDNSFNSNGLKLLIPPIGEIFSLNTLGLDSGGKILAGGSYKKKNYEGGFGIFRFKTNGDIDNTFGTDGFVFTNINIGQDDDLYSILVQPDGKIVASGGAKGNYYSYFELVRYEINGSLDISFGQNGIVSTDLPYQNSGYINASAFQQAGKIVVVGRIGKGFTVARYLTDKLSVGVVDVVSSVSQYLIFPNPVHDNVQLHYELNKEEKISVSLSDLMGRQIQHFKKNEYQSAGKYELNINLDEQIPKGYYLLQISSSHSALVNIKIIKD